MREGRIISMGYNGAPAGLPHCQHPAEEKSEFSDAGAMGCKESVHAELNAIAFAARHGVATEGAELYTTLSPCYNCAKAIINAGIMAVYALIPYRDNSAMRLLEAAGVTVISDE